MYVEFFFFFFFFVWNYYFISARWLPPLRINKVKVKVKSKKFLTALFKNTRDFEVQKPPSHFRFSLPSITIKITSNEPCNTETNIITSKSTSHK